jgi:hypothetical protein
MAATSEELSAQASQLSEVMAFFKVNRSEIMHDPGKRDSRMIAESGRQRITAASKPALIHENRGGFILEMKDDMDKEFEEY